MATIKKRKDGTFPEQKKGGKQPHNLMQKKKKEGKERSVSGIDRRGATEKKDGERKLKKSSYSEREPEKKSRKVEGGGKGEETHNI